MSRTRVTRSGLAKTLNTAQYTAGAEFPVDLALVCVRLGANLQDRMKALTQTKNLGLQMRGNRRP
jgi:hypothetical protein